MTEYGGTTPHLYVSTACQHGLCSTGMPGEGTRCRETCKFCGVGCLHECHAGGVPDDPTLRDRIAATLRAVMGDRYWEPGELADVVIAALKNIPAGC